MISIVELYIAFWINIYWLKYIKVKQFKNGATF